MPGTFLNLHYGIAALAAWSVTSATIMMATKPDANLTNSMKNGRARRSRSMRLVLLFGLFIGSYLIKVVFRVGVRGVEPYNLL